MPLSLIFIQPGDYTIEDDGIPGNNTSVIKDGNGNVIFTFAHPADALTFTTSTPGVNLTINFTDSLGAANLTLGSLTDPAQSFASIVMQNVETTGAVTLVSNGSITEGNDADAAADIVAGSLVMSAGTGIGTAGNAIETRTGLFEAETTTGGIAIGNSGSVQIGGISADVEGLNVATSGDISFTSLGSIFLTDATGTQVVHGGTTSGNVTLTAAGFGSDIIGNVDNTAVSASRGSIGLTAGQDIQLGTIGTDFNNDVVANGSVTFNAGRDVLIDGFADVLSDNFGLDTGGNLSITAGRNIGILNIAGLSASVTASGSGGGDLLLTTGSLGTLTVRGPGSFAAGSTSGDVVALADRVIIDAASGISAPSGTITIAPATAGRPIILGSASDAAFAVELSDAELDRIFAPNLIIGNNSAGPVTTTAALTPANVPNVIIRSGTNINVQNSITTSGSLRLSAVDNVIQGAASVITTGTLQVFVDSVDDDPGVGGSAILNGTVTGQSVINGNLDGDTLNGTGGANFLNGLAGNDTLRGFGGADTLDGGAGADSMDGGTENDIYFVDNVDDTIIEAVGAGYDTVFTEVSYTLSADVDRLVTTNPGSTAALSLSGNALANEITGNAGANQIDGGAGADLMVGGNGNDIYYVDNAGDVVSDGPGGGYDTVFTTVNFVLATQIERVLVRDPTSTTALSLTGNASANEITGNDGGNMINGGGGADLLIGRAGTDAFVFNSALGGGNIDALPDYQPGIDRFYLDDAVFTGLTPGALPAGAFTIGTAAGDADDRIVYNPITGALLYDADGNGAGAAIQFATVHEALAMSASDFQVI